MPWFWLISAGGLSTWDIIPLFESYLWMEAHRYLEEESKAVQLVRRMRHSGLA